MAATDLSSSSFELPDTIEAIEFYYKQGLTDGLPVIPPTPERVQQFLDCAGLEPKDVLGTRPSRNWVVTADKVAINAVMAGCLPEYAPVVAAAVRALLEPDFNASAIAETAGTSAPLMMVNGPIRHRLNINYGWNLFGPGWRANATMGRALRLILINVCKEVPGITDKSTFGHPGRYTFCIAENEEASPWEPYHVEKGYPIDSSAVSLFSVFPPMEVYNQCDNAPEEILDTLSHTIAANVSCHGEVIVILSPEHAGNIDSAKWSKARVKEYIAERASVLRPTVAPHQARTGALSGTWYPGSDDPSATGIPTTPDGIVLLVAGGGGGGHSTVLPTWGKGLISKSAIQPVVEPLGNVSTVDRK
ncbi:MAG: hypothetical protein V3U26_00210 [Dehalococcoidia bacterium]